SPREIHDSESAAYFTRVAHKMVLGWNSRQ
ncbi:unnamed protein product, partial [marine sediment metagenome]